MGHREISAWLLDKYDHNKEQPMGQFLVVGNQLLLTLSWPIYGGYCGYSCFIKKLP